MPEDRYWRLLLQFLRNPEKVFFVSYTIPVMIWPITSKLEVKYIAVCCFKTCSSLMLHVTQFTGWHQKFPQYIFKVSSPVRVELFTLELLAEKHLFLLSAHYFYQFSWKIECVNSPMSNAMEFFTVFPEFFYAAFQINRLIDRLVCCFANTWC